MRSPLRDNLVGVPEDNDRLYLIHTPEFVGAITEYNDELTGYDPRLAELEPTVFRFGGNAYHITGSLCRQRGWRVEEFEDRRSAGEATP
jgi:hypothetical protein